MDYVFEYQIYSYHLTTRGSEAYSIITSDEEYDDYVTYTLTHNSYANAPSIDFSERPSLLTLSTCSGKSGSGSRFVVHTVKVNTWKRVK